MKKPLIFFGAIVVLILALIFGPDISQNENISKKDTTVTSTLEITPISHASMMLRWSDGVIMYTDPVNPELYTDLPNPYIILITDIHGDHFSTSTLSAVSADAVFVVPQAVKDLLPSEYDERTIVLKNNEHISLGDLAIEAVPMYNIPESDDSFHTKGRGNGYIVERNNERIYIAGDTSGTPEMKGLKDIDIAFIPMNLPYTMSVEEATEAVLTFKPKHVYPYHYRGQNGLSDVNKFKELVNNSDPSIDVVLADWYPEQ